MDLTIKTEEGVKYRIMGNARFFVVRGDSAMIPQELSFKPDSTRWYIERWEDYTLNLHAVPRAPPGRGSCRGPPPRRPGRLRRPGLARPHFDVTWGRIKSLYSR